MAIGEEERRRLGAWYVERRTELGAFADDLSWELIVAASNAAEDYYRDSDGEKVHAHAQRLESLMTLKRGAETALAAIARSVEHLNRMEELERARQARLRTPNASSPSEGTRGSHARSSD